MRSNDMKNDVSLLFEPLTVKGKLLPNRVVMPPMVTNRGIVSQEGLDWYGEHAQGGVGLLIVEAVPVYLFGSELKSEQLKRLVEVIHRGGALAAIQLFPGIRVGKPHTPGGMSLEEIEELVSRYLKAAEICAEAGFDGIEPHGAHGYLLNRFFSPVKNKRSDDYGGSLENRMRLALQIVGAVKPVCDNAGMLLLYRHTPVGAEYGIEDSHVLAERLAKGGVDILDMSPSSEEKPGDRAAPFMDLGVPVIAVHKLDEKERFTEALTERRADLIAIGRGLIADPEWPLKVKEGRFRDITRCIKCNELCYGNLRKKIPTACTQWK
jgi:2,4-dienoyl-CoA reductase-like NADH-dependent reductase (Old Yellow Enzyme family)